MIECMHFVNDGNTQPNQIQTQEATLPKVYPRIDANFFQSSDYFVQY